MDLKTFLNKESAVMTQWHQQAGMGGYYTAVHMRRQHDDLYPSTVNNLYQCTGSTQALKKKKEEPPFRRSHMAPLDQNGAFPFSLISHYSYVP